MARHTLLARSFLSTLLTLGLALAGIGCVDETGQRPSTGQDADDATTDVVEDTDESEDTGPTDTLDTADAPESDASETGPDDVSPPDGDDGGTDGGDADDGPTCGNGVVEMFEQCDDGNDTNGDGCDNDCTYSCTEDADCSDGNFCNGEETCDTETHECTDPGDKSDGTACDVDGDDEKEGTCNGGACTQCGNGTVEAGEECDDGNDTNGDGCDNDCTFSCTDDSDCSDGNFCNGEETCDTSSHTCTDPGDKSDGTACGPNGDNVCRNGTCVPPSCGDGTVDSGEECDDGNNVTGDGCTADCQRPTAFRLQNDVEIVDPQLGIRTGDQGTCFCVEDANGLVNGQIQTSVENYAFNVLEVFRPLDPSESTNRLDFYPAGTCSETNNTVSCSPGNSPSFQATADNEVGTSSTCFQAKSSRTSSGLTDPNSPSDPCFSTQPRDVQFQLQGCSLQLQDARLAASYGSNSQPTSLNNGVMAGFLSESEAANCTVDNDQLCGGSSTLEEIISSESDCRTSKDKDNYNGQTGWWLYINFSSEKVDWSQ